MRNRLRELLARLAALERQTAGRPGGGVSIWDMIHMPWLAATDEQRAFAARLHSPASDADRDAVLAKVPQVAAAVVIDGPPHPTDDNPTTSDGGLT